MKHLYTALITPFNQHDRIDFEALEKLVYLQIKAGVDGLVILGTTAEAELISENEQEEIIKFVSRLAKDKIKIIVGCGKMSTQETLASALSAFRYPIDSVMIVSPPYVKPDMRGLYEHFKVISDHKIPFIAYHHPFRTGSNPPLSVLESILQLPFCQGLKDASGGCNIMRSLGQKYTVYSGDDSFLLPHLSLGASGIISVCSNLIPEVFKNVLHTFDKNPLKALQEFSQFDPLIESIFNIPNPIGIKNALAHMNLVQDRLRLPYLSASSFDSENILKALQEAPKTTAFCPIDTSFSLI
jgi:4-hydroxy-tetrahydrodipicolinate synthase